MAKLVHFTIPQKHNEMLQSRYRLRYKVRYCLLDAGVGTDYSDCWCLSIPVWCYAACFHCKHTNAVLIWVLPVNSMHCTSKLNVFNACSQWEYIWQISFSICKEFLLQTLGRISLGVCTCFLGYYLTHFLFNLERFSFETRGRLSLESRRIHGVVFL